MIDLTTLNVVFFFKVGRYQMDYLPNCEIDTREGFNRDLQELR